MEVLPFKKIPEYFSRTLQNNMQSTSKHYKELLRVAYTNKSIHGLILMTFKEYDKDGDINQILRKLGWYGYRDHLTSQYMHYYRNGKYSVNGGKEPIPRIISFNERYVPYSLQGYSRVFMLGFYLELASTNKDKKDYFNAYMNPTIKNVMSNIRVPTIKIDWLIIMLAHWVSFLGENPLNELVSSGANYLEIMDKLKPEQSNLFFKNCLSYGASINDMESFLVSAQV